MCKLKKILYRLKHAPRQWYKKLDSFMENHCFSKTTCVHYVLMKTFGDNDFIIHLFYVDDLLIASQDACKIDNLKKELIKSFAMKDLGLAKQILSMKIFCERKSEKLWLFKKEYIERILKRFNMSKAKSIFSSLASHFKLTSEHCLTSEKERQKMRGISYASGIGSLMYAIVF